MQKYSKQKVEPNQQLLKSTYAELILLTKSQNNVIFKSNWIF